ncbi:response regulator transcription factor [Methylothermus subterraneus]
MTPIRVLIVDDHPVVRQGYRSYLEKILPLEVVEADSAQEAYRAFVASQPHVVVLDLSLPDVSGLEVLQRICRRDPNARVLVFTIHAHPLLVEKALAAGALGYVSKGASPKVLTEALQRVLRGERFVEPGLLDQVAAASRAKLARLTPREFEVFQLLACGRSVAEIAKLLHLSPKTVGVHQTRILRKLELPNAVHLALLAVQLGLVPKT